MADDDGVRLRDRLVAGRCGLAHPRQERPTPGVGTDVRLGGYRLRVDVRPVDPRDIENEWDASIYRVYFWSADGGACEEHELAGVRDVHEVLAWSAANAGARVP